MDVRSPDGTDVVFVEQGRGPVILIVHGGLSDERPWARVAADLSSEFRVVRIRRRLYRSELPPDPRTDISREVDDIRALTDALGQPCLLVGHSSGAVVALEALVRHPAGFSGAVLYEPPVVLSGQIGKPNTVPRARRALTAGQPGRALDIFLTDCVQVSRPVSLLVGALTPFVPTWRRFTPRQIDDTEAIDFLGRRVETYALIHTRTLFLLGDRSPSHLADRTRALLAVMPNASLEVLRGQGHSAYRSAPSLVAGAIATHARRTTSL